MKHFGTNKETEYDEPEVMDEVWELIDGKLVEGAERLSARTAPEALRSAVPVRREGEGAGEEVEGEDDDAETGE